MNVAEARFITIQTQVLKAVERLADGPLDFITAERPMLHIAALEQALPVKWLVQVRSRARQRAAGETIQLLARHAQSGQQHRLVEDHHRHGRLAHPVDARHRAALARRALFATHHDGRTDGLVPVLIDEIEQRLLAQPV